MMTFKQFLNETDSPLIERFVAEFGIERVFVQNENFIPTKQELQLIYSVLNLFIFDNKLQQIPIYIKPFNQICQLITLRNKKSNICNNNFYAVYSCIFKLVNLKNHDIQPMFYDDVIFVNLDYIKTVNFTLFVAALCHEMIHYYDRLYGEYPDIALFNATHKGIVKNSHTTPTFKNKMKLANDLNINVIQDGSGIQHGIYKKQAFDLACKGYKTITENGQTYIDLKSIGADNVPGITLIDSCTGILYDIF